MKLLKIFSAAAVGMLAMLPFSANAQSVAAGTVKVIKVTGTAQLDGTAIKNGDIFAQGKTIKTGAMSRVLVRFSNGAAMSVRENTEIKLTTFQQEPITAVKVATHEQIKSEPSKSNTQLNLNYGKIIARAHQMQAKGSKFEISTPVGAAGIRGSLVLVTFDPTLNKMIAASLQGTITATSGTSTETVTIRQGQQIEITATRDSSGNVTSFSMVVDRPITEADLLEILREIGVQLFRSVDATIVSPSDDNQYSPMPTPTPSPVND